MFRKLLLVACAAILSACGGDSDTEPTPSGSPPPISPSETIEAAVVEEKQSKEVCPPETGSGVGAFAGSESSPIRTVYGQVAKLESVGPPMEFSSIGRKVELSSVYYEGVASGSYVVPSAGAIGELKIDGNVLEIANADISSGCLDTERLGPILILFES